MDRSPNLRFPNFPVKNLSPKLINASCLLISILIIKYSTHILTNEKEKKKKKNKRQKYWQKSLKKETVFYG